MKYIKQFENLNDNSIVDTIKNLKKVPKELKEVALTLLKTYTKAGKGKITGLNLHQDLVNKIEKGNYPNGFDMGIDKDGFFIHTHRARSKSYDKPSDIPVKDIKFIDSTG
jgi:hypothetical protein